MSFFCHEHTANYKAQQKSGEVLYPPQRQDTIEISKYNISEVWFHKDALTFERR